MAMNVGAGRGKVKSDINVTPLVDVMLVLLIIIMLIAPMLQKGVDVKLPVASNTVDKPDTQDQTVVAIDASKNLYLNSVPVANDAELASKLSDMLADKHDKQVVIKADQDVQYGAVMDAMDALRQAGVENVGLITDKKVGMGTLGGGQ
ncbi:MAG TPA: biopolymer transporter ExbD [Vicinamibacterales bacterium]|nr:biopolymer transporter ExbD [Vicinamibacterales bacterium]